jgi:hypothetical protein
MIVDTYGIESINGETAKIKERSSGKRKRAAKFAALLITQKIS